MINIQETPQITRIYLVTNCHGDSNKVYIGKTKGSRLSDHKRTFGKQITYDYIDEIASLLSKDWKPLECFWIEYFKSLGFDVQNKNNGGGGVNITSLESKIKKSKPIIQYDLEGNFIKEWIGITEVTHNTNYSFTSIKESCLKINNHSYGFIWRYKKDTEILTNYQRPGKRILQYDINGDLIKEFNTLKQASKELDCTQNGISQVLRGKTKTIKGYIFKYK